MENQYDVIIIGGGINGTGVARDCALRGIKTLLIEKKDLSGGTTGASSGMVHGGLRYLLNDVKTTKISCKDSGYIQKMAPFAHFRIPFLYLMEQGKGPNVELLETFFEVYDRYAYLKNSKTHARLAHADIQTLEPGLGSQVTGAMTFDEWGVDPYRLCILNMKDAVSHGTELLLHSEVTGLLIEDEKKKKVVSGVTVRLADGSHEDFKAKLVINLAGPWAPKIAQMAGVEVKLRPAKGVHIVFDRRISNIGFITETIDKRSIFLMPYQNTSIIGTTDDDFYGDPDNLEVTPEEVEYLLEAIERVFPDIRKYRIIGTYVGVRPTLYEWGKSEDALSRAHKIFDHEKEGVKGFVSMAGGKLAAFRLMSQELTNVIGKKLRVRKKCTTHTTPLPGGESELTPKDMEILAEKYQLSTYAVRRLYSRHGTNTREILALIDEHPSWKRIICQSEPVIEAEIRYCIQQEWAETVSDIGRRTRLGWGGCQGAECVWPAALILAEEKQINPHQQAQDFWKKRWKSLKPYLNGVTLAQEELKQRFVQEADL